MRTTKFAALIAAAALVLPFAGCGGDDGPKSLDDLKSTDKIKIGVKIDQPGIGYEAPGSDTPEGIDIEMAKIIANALGKTPDQIEWVETVSANREPYLQNSTVDFVLASYSITDDRRKVVGQAGPYYVTGQQILVRSEDASKITGPDDLKGVPTCSVEGSTSLQRAEDDYGAQPAPFATYSECVEQLKSGGVDAVTTDGAILLGYAAQDPTALTVVGEPFSEERYGIGYNKDADGVCQFLNDTLQKAFDDGSWAAAFEATLGKSGVETPTPPTLDPCP